MTKLICLKQQQNHGEATGNKPASQKRASAAQLRIAKEINELNLPKTCQMEFPDADDLRNFDLVICPDEDFYRNGRFVFSFRVSPNYPHEPPKVKCDATIYHPNMDLDGNVCLNILREDWKPVLTGNSLVYPLQYFNLEPKPEDPLNKDTSEVLQSNWRLFQQNVRKAHIGATYLERCLK
ncbi:hypothetical protein HPB50_008835 [Hyalomma asiaticum]|uniref:Uncharacterized protein n=1 Tax=Hyalomma asiaticum TaxID=266040 RepID=A0ACB7THB8_HYAAI|nr:hypothetical protein HPB50_008835 [Hyalomma asiaticum]